MRSVLHFFQGLFVTNFHTSAGDVHCLFEKRDGPLLILIHGIQGTSDLFLPLLSRPLFKQFSLLIPDLPGFGQSRVTKSFDYTIPAFAKVIEDLIIAASYSEAIIIGHSLGGMIGTILLDSNTVKITGLISLEGNLTLADCGVSAEIASLSKEEFTTNYFPEFLNHLHVSKESSAAFRYVAVKQALPEAFFKTACSIVNASTDGGLLKTFLKSQILKLLIVGEKTTFASGSLVPTNELVRIPNSGHFLLHDNFETTCECIEEFLESRI